MSKTSKFLADQGARADGLPLVLIEALEALEERIEELEATVLALSTPAEPAPKS